MKYVYLVFMYQPKYRYGGFIHEGHYHHIPKVFSSLSSARIFIRSYRHCCYIRKVRLY